MIKGGPDFFVIVAQFEFAELLVMWLDTYILVLEPAGLSCPSLYVANIWWW